MNAAVLAASEPVLGRAGIRRQARPVKPEIVCKRQGLWASSQSENGQGMATPPSAVDIQEDGAFSVELGLL